MQEVTWEDFEAFVKKSGVVIVPVGSTEQHGPHLPLGVDAIIPFELSKRLAEKMDIMIAPSITWGFKPQPGSSGGGEFPGTCSLDGTTLIALLRDLLRELIRHKVKKIIVLDGHFENSLFLNEGVELALRDHGYPTGVKVVIARWFELVNTDEYNRIFPNFEGIALEHAANLETVMLLHFKPELVKKDKIRGDRAQRSPPYTVLPPTQDLIPKTGVLTEIKTVNAQQGEKIADIVVERLTDLIQKEFS